MRVFLLTGLTAALLWAALPAAAQDATFGAVVGPITQGGVNYLIGGASDLILDEGRGRLYLINTGQRRVEVYSLPQRRFLTTVQTDATPMSGAMSRDGATLYVTCFDGSSLNLIDLERLAVVRKVSLPAKPEGVAVGADERVLLTTIGTGPNNAANVLLLFDPSPEAETAPVQNVLVTPGPPPSPLLPPPAGRVAFAPRTNLIATPDGWRIIGLLAVSNTQRSLFVYDVASASILRARRVNETSSVLSVAPDGSKFMTGLRLFDAETMQVIAQQNAANLPYTLPTGSNFNVQTNQGGSVFSPDGSKIYSAFNFAPLQNPPARANISQLLINDPENLLTSMGIKLPENLSGNMVISSDGATIYALSESGFMTLPIGRLHESPLAVPDTSASLLVNDQCRSAASQRTQSVLIRNEGSGRFTATAQLVPTVVAGAVVPALPGGPGGGIVIGGGGISIVLPPTTPGGGTPPGVTVPGGTLTTQQQALVQVAPSVRTEQTADGPQINFTFNPINTRSLGTVVPHDFQIVAPQAVNIPPQVRVYQNMRNSEARAEVVPVPVAPAGGAGLTDMAVDHARERIYITNAGLNRVEVFDMRSKSFMTPIKVGQLPRSLALTPDGGTLYVGNSGGESVSVIDVDRLEVIGKIKFPPLPFNSTEGVITPSQLVATERGVMMIMSNGTLWKIIGDEALPRPVSPVIGSTTVPAPRSMAATPNGEFAILLAGNGTAYLYDALSDEFVQSRVLFTNPIQGYYGPIAAGPRGQYFVVNGTVVNQSLSILSSAGTVTGAVPGRPGATATTVKPIAAVSAIGTNLYARFAPPRVAAANVVVTEPATVELVDPTTGIVRGQAFQAVEGPLSTLVGNNRLNINGRTMVTDAQGTTAYVLTTSGLSIVPLETVPAANRPAIQAQNGVVNAVSRLPQLAQGGIVSILGRNLGRDDKAPEGNLPFELGGVCVTINNTALPIASTSPGQVNVQIPWDLAAGRYPIVVRNLEQKLASAPANITVARYAPAVIVDPDTKEPAIFHIDGRRVNKDNPPSRDDRLLIYAVGLGPVTGVRLTAGQVTPESPEAVTGSVKVFIDDPTIREAEMDVESSKLVPGLVGVYQIQIYVPWYRRRGDSLPVTIEINKVQSPRTGDMVPYIPMR